MKYKAKCLELEKELGRYKKRCDDLMKINRELSKKAEGLMQVKASFDAWLIQVALQYGEEATDPDTGEIIPRMRALHLPRPSIRLLRGYQLARRVDESDHTIHIAVGLRNDPADEGKANGA